MEDTEQKSNPPQPSTSPASEGKDLLEVPMHNVKIAHMATYEQWVNTETKDLIEACQGIIGNIDSNETMEIAVNKGRDLLRKKKLIEKTIEEKICQPRKKQWQEGNAFRKRLVPPIEALIELVEKDIGTFKEVQERKRREEEEARLAEEKRRRDEEAAKKLKAEEEEARRVAKYEAEKLEQEVSHAQKDAIAHDEWWTAERDRKAAIAKEKKDRENAEEEARLKQAQAAVDANAEPGRADAILETVTPREPAAPEPKPEPKPTPIPKPEPVAKPEPVMVEAPKPASTLPQITTPEVPKLAGAQHKVKYHGEVTNVIDLAKYMIESGLSPDRLFEEMKDREQPFLLNEAWLNRKAIKLKDACRIPGMRAVPERATKLRV